MFNLIKNLLRIKKIILLLFITIWASPGLADETKSSGNPPETVIPVEQTNPIALALAPGTWREYQLSGGPTDGATLRWTWLETEISDGQSYQWFETQLTSPNKKLVTRILANPDHLSEPPRVVIMQMNDGPAQSMPKELRQKAVELLNNSGQTPAKSITTEKTKVLAGTYQTTIYEVVTNGLTQKTYISDSLPGLVLTETDAFRMELSATGTDGKSALGQINNPAPQ